MLARAAVGWLVILGLAILNGGLRQALLVPWFGEPVGHVVSTVLLSGLILGAAWFLDPRIRAASARDAWAVGALWVVLTVAFEFLAGHYLFGDPWARLLADYNLGQGRVWILVPVTTLLAPALARAWRLRARHG